MPPSSLHLDFHKPDGSLLQVEVMPVPFERRRHLAQVRSWKSILAAHDQQDAPWDWALLIRQGSSAQNRRRAGFEAWALEYGDELQAMMILDTGFHTSRRTGAGLVYIEYVAVAPWNRKTIQKPPKLGGCGTGMISVAIERSRILGKLGAVGLHSLSGAESFYRSLGFRELGADPAEDGLTYFEIP